MKQHPLPLSGGKASGASALMRSADSEIRALGLRRLAADLGVSVGFLRVEISRGRLRPTRLGRRVLLTAEEVRRYLTTNTPAPEAAMLSNESVRVQVRRHDRALNGERSER